MEDWSGFRDALLAQHREQSLALKRKVDEEIADVIMIKRIEVERRVHDLRTSHKTKLEAGLRANTRKAELLASGLRDKLRDSFISRLEAMIYSRLADLRKNGEYAAVMKNLALEAASMLALPTVALVEKGDSVYLSGCQGIAEIKEELAGVWGGLILVDANGRKVDNTFLARWKNVYPSILLDIQGKMSSDEAE